MRYFYKKPEHYRSMYGSIEKYDHPVYDDCTVFNIGNRGLSIIQQRYDSGTKHTWWGPIDPWLTEDLYLHENFKRFFDERSGLNKSGFYPTVTIRQIM